jgi:SOS-response transcriptional repressor LexA
VALLAENKAYPPLVLTDGAELEIWGVVIGLAKRIAG